MKITKLKGGFRIKCSVTDFEMLAAIVENFHEFPDVLFGPTMAAFTRRCKNGQPLMRVDQDNTFVDKP